MKAFLALQYTTLFRETEKIFGRNDTFLFHSVASRFPKTRFYELLLRRHLQYFNKKEKRAIYRQAITPAFYMFTPCLYIMFSLSFRPFFLLTGLCLSALAFSAYSPVVSPPASAPLENGVKWYTWEEAVALNKVKPKKMLIDVYTDWCGWCKVMDKKTFTDAAVAEYINKNFYAVKFNAEQKQDVRFNDQTFGYVETGGGRGVHTLAYALLDGKMGYPSIVYLNEKYERILISPGFKEVPDMLKELKFTAEDHYAKTSWENYKG